MVNERTRWWCWNLSLCYCAIGQTIKVFSCLSWNLNAVVIWRENQVWIHNTSDVFVITSTKQVMMSALFFLFLTFDLNTYISVTSYIVCRLCAYTCVCIAGFRRLSPDLHQKCAPGLHCVFSIPRPPVFTIPANPDYYWMNICITKANFLPGYSEHNPILMLQFMPTYFSVLIY